LSAGHIFISYPHTETEFTARLAADLKNNGVQVWMDVLEGGIRSGDDWRRAIEGGLDNSAAVISVICPDYLDSTYCRNELARADTLDLNVFPILLRTVDKKQWPIEIQRHQYTDFANWRDEAVYRTQLQNLLSVLKRDSSNQIGVIPDAETRYLTSLIAELESRKGVLEYIDLAGQMDEPTRPKPRLADEWGLEGSFALLEQQPSQSHSDEPDKKQQIPLSNIRDAVEKHPRLVLIGDPGAGKTTTLRRLALDAARERHANPKTAPLPLLLYLPTWGDEPNPGDFVRAQMEKAGIGILYSAADILLYLDGLNEMGAAGVEKAGKLRTWLTSKDAPKRVVITCRAGDYAEDLDLTVPTVLVGVMDEVRVRQFAEKYLEDGARKFLDRVLPDKKFPEYAGESEKSRSLFRLATNPYLLTALMVVFKSSSEGDLPRSSGALFRRLAMALWERERLRQTEGWIPFEQMESAFGQLAFTMIDEGKPIDVPTEYALQHIGAENLIRAAGSANVLDIGVNKVRFYHQLMQEYFAAVELEKRGIETGLEAYEITYFDQRVDQKWDQVILTLVGITSHVSSTLKQVGTFDPFLALESLDSGIITDGQQMVDVLMHLAATHPGFMYERVVQTITEMGQDVIPFLIHGLQAADWRHRYIAIEVVGRLKATAALPELTDLLSDESWQVRERAIEVLAEIGNVTELEPDLIKFLSTPNALPLTNEDASQLNSIPRENDPHILVVLTHKDVTELVKMTLELLCGYRNVKTASSGTEVINVIQSSKPDIIFIQRGLPGMMGRRMDGIEATIQVLKIHPDTRVILCSASSESEKLAIISGAADFVLFPYDIQTIFYTARMASVSGDRLGIQRVRRAAANVLGKLNSSRVIACLIEALDDADDRLCKIAILSLGSIGNRMASLALINFLRAKRSNELISCTEQALTQITNDDPFETILDAVNDAEPDIRKVVIGVLGKVKNARAVPFLIGRLSDVEGQFPQNTHVCDYAAQSLENIGTPEALEAVRKWREEQAKSEPDNI
jgi:HEAT repeat protein